MKFYVYLWGRMEPSLVVEVVGVLAPSQEELERMKKTVSDFAQDVLESPFYVRAECEVHPIPLCGQEYELESRDQVMEPSI